jgi:hypothetical protein
MEINAKLASLEDEVKLLKGEVKLILSEIRAAILGQDNPFAEPGQGLRADPGALESRPPIKVVRVPSEDEEPEPIEEPRQTAPQAIWEEDAEANEPEPAVAEEPPALQTPQEPAPAPITPIATRQAPVQPPVATARIVEPVSTPTPPAPAMPAPAPAPTAATPESGMPRWSLLTVAGLAVWAEEAVKQIGSKRLRILLDLCEFTGYVSGPVKEALLKVTSLGLQAKERTAAPSANECLVVLRQLDALLRGEETEGRSFSSLTEKWQQLA